MTREQAIKELTELLPEEFLSEYLEALDMAIKALEQEPKMGQWVKTIGENGVTSALRCSKCGFEDNRYELFNYCPTCGAKMREVEE